MLGAIFKLSHNGTSNNVVGGICGSCFSINLDYIITANHVINKNNFKPNEGYLYCQYWILSESLILEIFPENLEEFQDIEITLIRLSKENKNEDYYSISKEYSEEENCYNEGFKGEDMPIRGEEVKFNDKKIRIISNKCDLRYFKKKISGKISSIKKGTINTRDIKIKDVTIIECSYGGISGMSGGPLIKESTGEVIGMMSFGLPPDNKVKNKLFAISIEEILNVVEGSLR